MSVAEGTILRIVAVMLFPDSSIMQNVFAAVLTSAGGSSDEQDVTDDMVEYMEAVYANHVNQLDQDLTASEVIVYEWDAADEDWDELGSNSWTVAFNADSILLPRGVALVVNYNTSDPDVQGRKYFGGFTEASWEQGSWDAGLLTAAAAAAVDIVTTFVGTNTGATFQPVVWSPTQQTARFYTGAVIINAVAGYQRRRKPGVGV
jgi:hypothetical protein